MMRYTPVASALAMAMLLAACGSNDTTETASSETATENAVAEETAPAMEETANVVAPAATETPVPEASATATPAAVATPAAKETPAAAAAPAKVAATAPASFNVCKACHSVEAGKNGIGPTLAGVFGAKAGHVADFDYSDAMKDSGLTWNDATLNEYLTNPRKLVPGTKMSFGGLKDDAKRQELVDYLKTL